MRVGQDEVSRASGEAPTGIATRVAARAALLAALAGAGAGCGGDDVGAGLLRQVVSQARMTDLDVIVGGHVRETTEDVGGGGDGTDTATVDSEATGELPGDTGDTLSDADTTPIACDSAADCPSGGTCGTARCADHLCVIDARVCSDQSDCTTDRCDAAAGCVFEPIVCPDSDNPCEVGACDQQAGCVLLVRANGTACAEDNACTSGKACVAGMCVGGQTTSCDDQNACTSDACDAALGCVHTPIADCQPGSCSQLEAGAACDDGDADTSADLCLGTVCRGFELTRVPGNAVPGQEGLVITETRHAEGIGWSSIFWLVSSTLQFKWILVGSDAPAAPKVHLTTLQGDAFAGLVEGYVGDDGGRIWRYDQGAWSKNNDWDSAVGSSGRGAVKALFTMRDTASQGVQGKRRLWAVGDDDGTEWIRACGDGESGVRCSAQELDDFDDSSIPQAVFGLPRCGATGACAGALLVVGADAPSAGGEAYTDTFENDNGAAQTWSQGSVPNDPGGRASRDVIAWGPRDAQQFLVVGNGSYVVHRAVDGDWSDLYIIDPDPNYRNFTGAWAGLGVVMLSGESLADDGSVDYEIWTCPEGGDVEDASAWTKHLLANGPNSSAAGLWDVQGRANGEIRAVGAVRRVTGVADWLDGAVFVRTP